MACDMVSSMHSSRGSIQVVVVGVPTEVEGWGICGTVVQGIGQAGESAVQTTSHHRQRAREMSEQNVLAEAGDENSFLAAPSKSFYFPAASSGRGISH